MKTETVVKKLIAIAASLKTTGNAVKAAKAKNAGAYVQGVQLAIDCGDHAVMDKAFDELFAAIRVDGKLAVKCGAPKLKKEKKDGQKYGIPSSLSTVRTALNRANKYAVPLTDDEGAPRPFNQIRRDAKEAADAAAANELTGDKLVKHMAAEALTQIRDAVGDMEGDTLNAVAQAIFDVRDAIKPATDTDSEGDTLAEAA